MKYYRKVIKIRAEDSPNVRYAFAQKESGQKPTGEIIVPGVVTWGNYVKRRGLENPKSAWDKVRQTIGLDAEFYEGSGTLLYPPEWLSRAAQIHRSLIGNRILRRPQANGRPKGKAMGIDPAEGGDKSAWVIIDDYGILHAESLQTPNTAVVPNRTIALGKEWAVPVENWVFDRGGGGYEHACTLRERGYKAVRSVGFNEGVNLPMRRKSANYDERLDVHEEKSAYVNSRAEKYGRLRELIDPDLNPKGFGIPSGDNGEIYEELWNQLSVIPYHHDGEGRVYVPPKNKPSHKRDPLDQNDEDTLTGLIGHSPDELDALIMAVYGLTTPANKGIVGVVA